MVTKRDEGQDRTEFEGLVGVMLTASRAFVAVSASSLAAVEDMLTLSEFRALVVLRTQGACRTSSLARKLAVSPVVAQRVVERLVEDDYLHADHAGVLELTERGVELVETVTEHRRAALAEIVERLDDEERHLLVDALIAFSRAAGEPFVA